MDLLYQLTAGFRPGAHAPGHFLGATGMGALLSVKVPPQADCDERIPWSEQFARALARCLRIAFGHFAPRTSGRRKTWHWSASCIAYLSATSSARPETSRSTTSRSWPRRFTFRSTGCWSPKVIRRARGLKPPAHNAASGAVPWSSASQAMIRAMKSAGSDVLMLARPYPRNRI